MRRSEVEAWIANNGGQKDYQVKYVDIPNTNKAKTTDPDTIKVPQITWLANNGQRLTVIDDGSASSLARQKADPGGFANDPNVYDPDYMVVNEGDPKEDKDPVDNRTPEKKAQDAEIQREREWNQSGQPVNGSIPSGRYESHEERRQRERQETADANTVQDRQQAQNDRALQIANQQAAQQLAQDKFDYDKDKDRRAEAERAADRERQRELDNRRLDVEGRQLTIAEERAARERAMPVGQINEDMETIARFNPETGQIEAQSNPIYNRLKAEAARKREQLATAIQMRQLDAQEAATEYTRWYKEHIETPLLLAGERRAQAAEQRQTLQAEEQRRQFAAGQELERGRLGQQGANMMLDAEMALNPYRVGPTFGKEMSSAINSLAHGGRLDGPAADAGINFTADAFEYKKPDLAAIARKGTAAALKNITPYRPLETSYQGANYEGLTIPTGQTMQNAPKPAASPYDTKSLYESLYGPGTYSYPTQ